MGVNSCWVGNDYYLLVMELIHLQCRCGIEEFAIEGCKTVNFYYHDGRYLKPCKWCWREYQRKYYNMKHVPKKKYHKLEDVPRSSPEARRKLMHELKEIYFSDREDWKCPKALKCVN